MKNNRFWGLAILTLVLGYATSCTKNDQILDTNPADGSNELVAIKTATAPTIDGQIDASWDNATKLNVTPEVPNPGNGMFIGYIGTSYNVSIRSMYDDQNLYILAEWNDPDASLANAPWYFSPTTHRWTQESANPVFDVNGILTRDAFNEDKFAVLWNISCLAFETATCYGSCHMNTATYDPTTGATIPPTSGNHYTNAANEKIDQWHIHLMKDVVATGQGSDEYQDWNSGKINGNGRHADGLIPPTYTAPVPAPGPTNNRQTIVLTGTTTSVTVPRWVKLNATNYYFIPAGDTLSDPQTVLITAVDTNGVMTYSGGTIDPNGNTDYQQIGSGDGAKCIPGSIVSPMQGSRADLTCSATHTGTGWILEIKRALKTTDGLLQDADFSSLADQPFGIAVFNKANNQHAIKPDLLLKFQK